MLLSLGLTGGQSSISKIGIENITLGAFVLGDANFQFSKEPGERKNRMFDIGKGYILVEDSKDSFNIAV